MGREEVIFDALVECAVTEGFDLPDDGPRVVIDINEAVDLIEKRLRERGL